MDLMTEFKNGMKKSWLNGKAVGAYAPLQGFWAAIAMNGETNVLDSKKEASKWIKQQYYAHATSETVH